MQQKDVKTLQFANALGDIIKQLRKDNTDMSLDNFANAYGINKGTLSTIENGTFNVKLITLWKISEALGIKCSQLIVMLEERLGDNFKLIED